MTNTDRKIYCRACGLEILPWEKRCPRCSHEKFAETEVEVPNSFDKEYILLSIENILKQADGYIITEYKCPWHDGKHYMVYPGKRDRKDYNKISRLTTLPQCPVRVWKLGDPKGIGMPLNKFLDMLEVRNG